MNTLITPSVIAKEALMQLENNLVMGNLVHRTYKNEFVKVGNTVSIRKPVKFVASDGATRVNQDVVESTTSIVVDKQKHVSWSFSSQDLTMTIAEYSKRYINPAVIALANQVDYDLCGLHVGLYQQVGTAGSTPASFADLGAAGQRMDEMAIPKAGRRMVLNPAAEWSLADALKGVYQNEMVKQIIKEAYLGRVAKFDIAGDQNVCNHTKGTLAAGTALQVNAQPAEGATSIVLKDSGGSLTGTLVEGDVLTFATCYDVNPKSGEAYSYLKQFRVTALCTAASNLITATVEPAFNSAAGAYKTCSARPAASQAATLTGNHAANLAFIESTFALVMLPMEMPDGAAFKARETDHNLSIRVVKDYDIDNDVDIIRLDILYGVKCVYPDTGVVLLG